MDANGKGNQNDLVIGLQRRTEANEGNEEQRRSRKSYLSEEIVRGMIVRGMRSMSPVTSKPASRGGNNWLFWDAQFIAGYFMQARGISNSSKPPLSPGS
jgi:hypothetical protein